MLRNIRHLSFGKGVSHTVATPLICASPNLRSLRIAHWFISSDLVADMRKSFDRFDIRIECLELQKCMFFTQHPMDLLSIIAQRGVLTELILDRCEIYFSGGTSASSTDKDLHLKSLRCLTLMNCNSIPDSVLLTLLNSVSRLQELRLINCVSLTEWSLGMGMSHGIFNDLKVLDVSGTPCISHGMIKLISETSIHLQQLTLGSLDNPFVEPKSVIQRISDESIEYLARFLKNLHILELHGCVTLGRTEPENLATLIANSSWTLVKLDLSGTGITNDLFAHLIDTASRRSCPMFPHLKVLRLESCHGIQWAIDRASMTELMPLEYLIRDHMPSLRNLYCTRFDEMRTAYITGFRQSPLNMSKIQLVSLRDEMRYRVQADTIFLRINQLQRWRSHMQRLETPSKI